MPVDHQYVFCIFRSSAYFLIGLFSFLVFGLQLFFILFGYYSLIYLTYKYFLSFGRLSFYFVDGIPLLWASLIAQLVKNPPAMWETWVRSLGLVPGEGKGYPLQYSSLENSMDCIVHQVTKSQTRLRDFHFTFLCKNILVWCSPIYFCFHFPFLRRHVQKHTAETIVKEHITCVFL